jgi:Protein of unknown function (DUF3429)
MTRAPLSSDDHRIPPIPLLLGAAGLIPFAGLALMLATGILFGFERASVHGALATYGALILSFLGGIRWGLALSMGKASAANREFALSVVPQLLAWASLALPAPWDLRALAALVLALGVADLALARQGGAPAWFGRLRLGLTAGAAVALLVGSV